MSLKLPLKADAILITDANGKIIAVTNVVSLMSQADQMRHAAELVRLANQHGELLAALDDVMDQTKAVTNKRWQDVKALIARCKEAK